ncbi:MAG TPA: DUF2938 domain-containing protein [Burkholderiaceae bacterium]|nr:DUF2938 domain-containing protein [Burkholderiaceae bacterium]
MNDLIDVIALGVGATWFMDAWGLVRKPLLGVAPPNYGLVGRWLGHLVQGRFCHEAIAASAPVRGERFIGWSAHYLIGIAFAAVLLALWGADWLKQPSLGPALAVGLAAVAAPFFIMQPGMGLGIAASRAPKPASARLHSLITHAIFGLGLYLSGLIMQGMASL